MSTSPLRPFEPLKKYTLSELMPYWDNLQEIGDDRRSVIPAIVSELELLMLINPAAAVETITDMLKATMAEAVQSNGQEDSFLSKMHVLCKLLANDIASEHLRDDVEMTYIGVTHMMCSAHTLNKVALRMGLDNPTLALLNRCLKPLMAAADNKSDLVAAKYDSLTAEVAARLFPQEWCLLVEPNLLSVADILKAIWIERPPLLITPAHVKPGSSEDVERHALHIPTMAP